ncbi:MFS transporter [Dietzia sp. UBA5065]|uniref:MFS transporter n=1 Tax=Dietzia sp. UBA5065 TaxID=1946422 RepID=UPI0025C20273|nr:MFS transporter [Dietzia sp. UBA5065]HMT49166.1 MFS transporter [Dietzia sp.]
MNTTPRTWPPFVLIALVVTAALMSSATPSPLYVDYQETWGTSGTMITVVYAVYAVAVLVPLLFLGRLSDAIGRRPVVIAGLALLVVSMAMLAAAPSVAWLIPARVVQGLGVGLVTGSAAAALIELHPTRNARASALTSSSTTNFGIAAGVLLSGAVATSSSSPLVHPYVVMGVALAALLVGVILVVPETSGAGPATLREAVRVQRIAVPAETGSAFALAAVCVSVSWAVGGVFLGLGGAITKDLVGRSDYLVTGLVVACLQGAAAIAQLVWNLRAGPSMWRRGVVIGVATMLVGVVAASLTLEAGSVPGFVVASIVTGLGMGLLFLMGTTLVAQSAPDGARGEVFSALFVVAYISLGVPAVVAALAAEVIGLAVAFHLLVAAVSVISIGALVAVARSAARGPRA